MLFLIVFRISEIVLLMLSHVFLLSFLMELQVAVIEDCTAFSASVTLDCTDFSDFEVILEISLMLELTAE